MNDEEEDLGVFESEGGLLPFPEELSFLIRDAICVLRVWKLLIEVILLLEMN